MIATLRAGAITAVIGFAACQQLDEVGQNAVESVTVEPSVAYLTLSSTVGCSASVQPGYPRAAKSDVTWKLRGEGCTGASCGTLSFPSSGNPDYVLYEAPAVAPVPPVVSLIAAADVEPSKTGVVQITIGGTAITVTIDPPGPVHIHPDESAAFEATVTGDPANAGVRWVTFQPSSEHRSYCYGPCGSVSSTTTASGATMTFTASPPSAFQTFPTTTQVVASSVTDPTKEVRAYVVIDAP